MEREKVITCLFGVGFTRPIAKILGFLITNDEYVESKLLERQLDLRQPEVSIAINYIKKKGWLSVKEKKTPNKKGAPIKLVKLNKGLSELKLELIHIIEAKMNNLDKVRQEINENIIAS